MELRQTLEHKVGGYWDGGTKDTFTWSIDGNPKTDSKGQYVRIGSWEANHWFYVACGKTEKQTLANAKRHLRRVTRVPSEFEYTEEAK